MKYNLSFMHVILCIPYLHSRTIEYLQDISIEEVKPVEVLPIYPLMRSYLDLLVDYMKNGTEIPDLHRAKEYELFSLFKICYKKNEIASIFRDALSNDLQFFVSVMTHYKACRTAKELAVLCGYNDTVFTQLFKKTSMEIHHINGYKNKHLMKLNSN